MRRLLSIALLALICGAAYADLYMTTSLGRAADPTQAACTLC
jgi:hypothetical protein